MKAFILSGGFGSKLREVIYNQPKVLATVKGQTFLDHMFYLLKKRGFTEIVLGLGYLSGMVKDYVVQRPLYDLSVLFSIEPRPLGTAGALKYAEKYLDSTFFVINGDTYLDIDYQDVLKFHKEKKAKITIVTAENMYADGFGKVETNKQKEVVAFVREPQTKGQTVHAGIYVLEPEVLDNIVKGERCSIEKDILPEFMKKHQVFAYHSTQTFFDIGDATGYKLAQEHLER